MSWWSGLWALRVDSLWTETRDAVSRYLMRRPWLTPDERVLRTGQVGLYHRVVWSLPASALAHGWSTHAGDDTQDVTEDLDGELAIGDALLEARAAARRDGGAWLWPVLAGAAGKTWSEPLGPGPHEVVALHVLTAPEVAVLDQERDPTSRRWGRPALLSVTAQRDGLSYVVPRMNASRLVYVPGAASTPEQRTSQPGYDLPVLELYREAIDSYEAGLTKTGRLLERLSMPWVSLKQGAATFAGGAPLDVQERLTLLREGMGTAALLVLTGEDEAGWSGPTLAGVRDSINVIAERISAIEGWPLSDLFGTPPGGLSTDDEAGRRAKSALLGHERALLGRVLLDLYRLALGPDPKRRIEWPPLESPTAAEAAAISLQLAQRDAVLIDAGVIGPDESRQRVRDEGEMELDDGPAVELPAPPSAPHDGAMGAVDQAAPAPPQSPPPSPT